GAARLDQPASGGAEGLGAFRTFSYIGDSDGRQRAIFGDTFTALVEFGRPLRAKVINTYGNSSQPQSPYYGDQMALAARNEMRDALLKREQVEAALAKREWFRY
ncbi:penicillin acylase family protein, partial [Chromobacterium aquaticum]